MLHLHKKVLIMKNRVFDTNYIMNKVFERDNQSLLVRTYDTNNLFNFVYDDSKDALRVNIVNLTETFNKLYNRYVFRESFIGDGNTKTFQLTGDIQNGTWDEGTWTSDHIILANRCDITTDNFSPVYDSTNIFTRNRVKVISADSSGLITLDYAPRNGQVVYVWYWYSVADNDVILNYQREDYVAEMEVGMDHTHTLSQITDYDEDNFLHPWSVDKSIEYDAVNKVIYLVGDEETPGNNKVYGTNFSGEKVWKDDYPYDKTKEPTGFTNPFGITVTYNPTTTKITLTGDVEAYCHGEFCPDMVSGWESLPLTDFYPTPNTLYYLYWNGIDLIWSTNLWHFSDLQIACVFYRSDGTFRFALRECHGFMPWQAHVEFHNVIGCVKESGNGLTNYVLNSTVVAERRPDTNATYLADEDLRTLNPAHINKLYSQARLSDAGTMLSYTDQADIVPLNGNIPFWNQFNGTNWIQTPMAVGSYMSLYQVAMPTSADATSQKLRYFWIQGQSNGTLSSEQTKTTFDINLGNLASISPEFVFINKVIIRYIANNWFIAEVINITGNKVSQIASPSGNYLSAVNSDESLEGNGTAPLPLKIAVPTNIDINYSNGLITDLTLDYSESTQKTVELIYDIDGKITSIVKTQGGNIKTTTLTYDVDGNIINIETI